MKEFEVMLYFSGSKNKGFLEEVDMEDMINFYTILLPRVPNVGEVVTVVIDDYCFQGKVEMVYTNYCRPGNQKIEKSGWGYTFGISLKDLEVESIMASANLCLRCWHYKNGKCIAHKGDYCRILKDKV